MHDIKDQIRVFISSKTGKNNIDYKYELARSSIKYFLESTNLFEVYLFEDEGASTDSAIEHYTGALEKSDVCIFLIDNKDDVPVGVRIEIETAKKYNIPSLYYFCKKESKRETSVQTDLKNTKAEKYLEIDSFSEFIERCPKDLINDIISTYRNRIKLNNQIDRVDRIQKEQDSIEKEFFMETYKDDATIDGQVNNKLCRGYFAKIIFENKILKVNDSKNNLDYYCFKYLGTLFEGEKIESFNMNLFLNELQKLLPEDYYDVISKRWLSIQEYQQGKYDRSIEILEEAYEMAEKKKVPEWLIKDILIDWRNRELETNRIYQHKSKVYDLLAKKKGDLYHPFFYKNKADLYDWIEKDRQNKETLPFNAFSFYGDLSSISNYIADIYTYGMITGSFSQIKSIYKLIQRLSYQLCSFSKEWPNFMVLLKNTIISLEKNRVKEIWHHFDMFLNKMNAADAKEIYEYMNNISLKSYRFCGKLIAMAEIGYYFSDRDFENYWDELSRHIYSWLDNKDQEIFISSYIFECIGEVKDRIDKEYILKFCLKILDSGKIRYYDNIMKLLFDCIKDYSQMDDNLVVKLFHELKRIIENKDVDNLEYTKLILCHIGETDFSEKEELHNFIKIKWKDYYNNEYLMDITTSKDNITKFIKNKIIEVKQATDAESGLVNSENLDFIFYQCYLLLKEKNITLGTDIIDELFLVGIDTIMLNEMEINNKIKVYILLLFLCRFESGIVKRNEKYRERLVQYKSNKEQHKSMLSYIDTSVIDFANSLLLSCFGKDEYKDLSFMLSSFRTVGEQVTICKLILPFLYNIDKSSISNKIENLMLQYGLMWSNSDSLDVRWYAIQILIELSKKKKKHENN